MTKYDTFDSVDRESTNMKLKLPQISDIKNKTVLVRVDFNVPLKKDDSGVLKVTNDERITASLETINFLLKHDAKVVLASHLGRPESARDVKYSLRPVAEYMKSVLGLPVVFSNECIGKNAQKEVFLAKKGEIVLLENIRFHSGEQENDAQFAKELSKLADVYINEAFSTSHRAHASIVGIPKHLPSFAGFALEKEVSTFTKMTEKPERPLVIILGGAKISDKVGAIEHLAKIADIVLVGGAVANSFLKAEGLEIYKSFIEDAPADLKKKNINYTDVACSLLEEHKTEKMLMNGYIPLPKIVYPIDVVAGHSLEEADPKKTEVIDLTKENGHHDKNLLYLDIGPNTVKLYQEIILHAKTVFWNGPMGVWENPVLANGSKKIAASVALSNGTTIIGGGDTIACATHFGLDKQFSYVSAAGGAALDFLSGKKLPGLVPLEDK
ncbi:MAG: phosphoglycerate kinase [Patescibacteria group bacterium]|nr:MAG: phosphoglycerate kinase [Patescibacteria group bacterium]